MSKGGNGGSFEMSNASVKKLRDLLLVSVPEHLLDSETLELRRAVGHSLRQHRSAWVVLDFAAVEICDSFFGRFVQAMADTARLQGANVIVCGLQDGVVETMVELGFDLAHVPVALDVDDALEHTANAERQRAGANGAATTDDGVADHAGQADGATTGARR